MIIILSIVIILIINKLIKIKESQNQSMKDF